MKNIFKGKTILITGATGSLGTELVRELLKYKPYSIRAFDCDENGLFELREKFGNKNIRYLLGSIVDYDRLDLAMRRVDYVIHSAAVKHVRISNYNPFEVIKTNVIGTMNVIKAVLRHKEVKKFIFISSDKACFPANIYGTSKMLGEQLVLWSHKIDLPEKVSCVIRSGNFLGSRGSVVPKWRKLIKEGKDITLTNCRMNRFITTTNEFARKVIKALTIAKGGEIFVPKQEVANMNQLANVMAEGTNSKIKLTKPEEGEKLDEVLVSLDESERYKETEDFYIFHKSYPKKEPFVYSTEYEKPINDEELKRILEKI